jgi:hypothetical protein
MSLFAEKGCEVLQAIPSGCKDIVVKAHSADSSLLSLLELSDARVIITRRDPCDSIVSQNERFGLASSNVISGLSLSFASIAMIQLTMEPLLLQYEDGFTSNRQTLALIADFLGLTVDATTRDTIFESLRPEVLRRQIDTWAADSGNIDPLSYDPATHWHPGHIGDGRIGKGRERLPPEQFQAISDCFRSLSAGDLQSDQRIRWSSALFWYADRRTASLQETLDFGGDDACLIYGPYFYLPIGRWRAVPQVEPVSSNDFITFKIDVLIGQVLEVRTVTLPTKWPDKIAIEFNHVNHNVPIEIRFYSVGDGRKARLKFAGVELIRLGPCDTRTPPNACPVGLSGFLTAP